MPENEDFNLEELQREFEESWTDEEETEEIVENDEVEDEVETDGDDQETEEVEESTESEINDPDTEKRNKAFAEMRRQNQELQKQLEESGKYSSFLKNLADQNGTTPDELLKRYQERQLEQDAEKQGVPVDVLKRIQSLETENQTVKQSAFAERFNTQVESTINKFGAKDSDVEAAFKYAAENGIDFENTRLSFEAVYQMAHHETLTQKAVEQALQKELSAKKKRQESSAIPSGTSVSPNSDELSDEEVLKALRKMDINI